MATEERGGRSGWSFRTVVAILIAAVSVLGAVAAWRASVVSIRAADLDEDALLSLVQKEQIRARLESTVDQDLRLFAEYREHLQAWRLLERDAREVRRRNADLADALDAQAQGELALARALIPYFRGATPDLTIGPNQAAYDRSFVLGNLQELDPQFQELRPEAMFAEAREEHARTVNLVLVVALFVAALFFLTLAQFTSVTIRGIFAGAGLITAASAVVLYVLVGGFA